MTLLLLGLLLAAIVAFAGPTLLPQQARSPLADSTLRIIGVLGMLFAIASTSFVRVPDGHLGQLSRPICSTYVESSSRMLILPYVIPGANYRLCRAAPQHSRGSRRISQDTTDDFETTFGDRDRNSMPRS